MYNLICTPKTAALKQLEEGVKMMMIILATIIILLSMHRRMYPRFPDWQSGAKTAIGTALCH
jgi:hypothetical protein